MNYKYRVTLAGIKGFFRTYSVNGNNSLYTFHKQLRSDLEFPADQQILFKALDDNGNVVARYALIDIGSGTVDEVSIEKAIKAGARSFVYFYDIAAKKSVIITLEGEASEKTLVPTLLESKGPVPLEFENGYVAFEDMPDNPRKPHPLKDSDPDDEDLDDEDEDDEDDEDEDKEEEDIIYDENEQ
ncbi:MAG: hypothetical protein KBS67_05700 [Bacteroidales bacterium]|nr:hypothetical protein [Candidatus Cryptobacteroides equifaecalis]